MESAGRAAEQIAVTLKAGAEGPLGTAVDVPHLHGAIARTLFVTSHRETKGPQRAIEEGLSDVDVPRDLAEGGLTPVLAPPWLVVEFPEAVGNVQPRVYEGDVARQRLDLGAVTLSVGDVVAAPILEPAVALGRRHITVGVGEQPAERVAVAHFRCPRRDPAKIATVGDDPSAHNLPLQRRSDRELSSLPCTSRSRT